MSFKKILSLYCISLNSASPLSCCVPSDHINHIKCILETLILVPMLIKFSLTAPTPPHTHFPPFISVCDVLGEFLNLTFRFTNSLFDYIQPRVCALHHTLIPMAIVFNFSI